MSNDANRITLISRIADELDYRGWRDPGDVALVLARALESGGAPRRAAAQVSSRFLASNNLTRADVESMIEGVLQSDPIAAGAPATSPREIAADASDRTPTPVPDWRTGKDQSRPGLPSAIRLAIASLVLVGGSVVVWLGPTYSDWRWLLDHPNRLAIQALAEVSISIVAAGIAAWKWQVIAAAGAPFLALLGLLGR